MWKESHFCPSLKGDIYLGGGGKMLQGGAGPLSIGYNFHSLMILIPMIAMIDNIFRKHTTYPTPQADSQTKVLMAQNKDISVYTAKKFVNTNYGLLFYVSLLRTECQNGSKMTIFSDNPTT